MTRENVQYVCVYNSLMNNIFKAVKNMHEL